MAENALSALPEPFAEPARALVVLVEDFPDKSLMQEMGCTDPYEITGVYEGIPETEKSVTDQPVGIDTIRLFRRPILDEWIARGDVALDAMVTHVLVHEVAHHFGWSDNDIAQIDQWWE